MFCLRCERVAGFFLRLSQFLRAQCFMLHAQAGQWRRNPAGRTRSGSRGPPFPTGASLPVRGAGCVFPSGQAPPTGPAHRFFSSLPGSCPSAALAVNPLCNQGLGLLTQGFSTGLPPKDVDIRPCSAPGLEAACALIGGEKSFEINDLSCLSSACPQACHQKMWILSRPASLGAALRRTRGTASILPWFASERKYPL